MAPRPAFELDWNLIRTFVAVAEGGSLAAASRCLGLAHPTVARHIQQLEAALGMVLFDRTSHGLSLTDDGRRLADQAAAMQREAIAFGRLSDSVRQQPPSRVRITASELLMELIPELLSTQWNFQGDVTTTVELIVSNEQLNLLERAADIAVRHVAPQQQDLICRRLGVVPMRVCATAAYLQGREPPTFASVQEHCFIDGATQSRFRLGAAALGLVFSEDQIGFRSDSLSAQRAAMLSGWGIAALPAPMVQDLPEVQQLFAGDVAATVDVWLVARPEIRNTEQLKRIFDRFGDALAARLRAHSLPGAGLR